MKIFKTALLSVPSLFIALIALCPMTSYAGSGNWSSQTVGANISYKTTESPNPAKDNGMMTIVYLENLGFEKIGNNSNEEDVEWLLNQGYRVIELDYANNTKAVSPLINLDIIAINDAVNGGSFCGLSDCSKRRTYILMEGYRIKRDVSYYLDDPFVYNWPGDYTVGDSIYMDIIYPANASQKVPAILSFSYSNSYHTNKNDRMFLGYTLSMFDDSFLEGAPAYGMAWAIADHPKYCQWGQGKVLGGANKGYASYETNPDAARKVKSAVRTLRAEGEALGLSGNIGVYGFSRGSTAASLAAGDRSVPEFEGYGRYPEVSDDIQVAGLGSGVFDFTILVANDNSGQLITNCTNVFGPLESNRARWDSLGSYFLFETEASAPVIFFGNPADELYYQNQKTHLKAKLDSLKVTNDVLLLNYGSSSAHAVPKDTASLATMYRFFENYLLKLPPVNAIKQTSNDKKPLLLSNNGNGDIYMTYPTTYSCEANIALYDMAGCMVYRIAKRCHQPGNQYMGIHLNELGLAKGVYEALVTLPDAKYASKFVF